MLAIGFWTGYFAGILTVPILLFVFLLFYILIIVVDHKKNMMKMVEHNAGFEQICKEQEKEKSGNV